MMTGSGSAASRALAVVMACLLAAVPSLSQAPERPVAGQINALISSTLRNNQAAKVRDEVNSNDVLRTDRSGRARLRLIDGSILSLGSNSELKVVDHNSDIQQTVLQLSYGKMRSRVVAIHNLSGRFEILTPVAMINVLGTDFYTQFDPPSKTFRVICYSGSVKVTGVGKFEAQSSTVRAGQMLEIGSAGFGAPQATRNAVQLDSIAETTTEGGTTIAGDSHFVRNVLIGAAAAAAGLVVGLVTAGTSGTINTQGASTASGAGSKKPPGQ